MSTDQEWKIRSLENRLLSANSDIQTSRARESALKQCISELEKENERLKQQLDWRSGKAEPPF